MDARKTLLLALAILLSGCAADGSKLRAASNTQHCPTGAVLVCTGMYDPRDELAPSCACADLFDGR